MKSFQIMIILIAITLLSSSCENMPHLSVEGDAQPRFVFGGSSVSSLLVYRIPHKYLGGKEIPDDELQKDIANKLWLIEGHHNAKFPIIYGVVPQDMKEVIAAKPLVEDEIYMVWTYMGAGNIGAGVGINFYIQNKRVVQIPDITKEKRLTSEPKR